MARKYTLRQNEIDVISDVQIDASIMNEVLKACRQTENELCVALYGRVSSSHVCVTSWRQCSTISASGSMFLMNTDELLRLNGSMTSRLVGVLHSHGKETSTPSQMDQYFIERIPLMWIILGQILKRDGPDISAFAGGRIIPRQITVLIK